jgi:hypothetical protein
MATEFQEIITREAPDIEAYKLGLMDLAKKLTSVEPQGGLPAYQVAGMTPAQLQAQQLGMTGVGAFAPLLGQAGQSIQQGLGTLGSAQNVYDTAMRVGGESLNSYLPFQDMATQGTSAAMQAAMGAQAPAQAAIQQSQADLAAAMQRGYGVADTAAGQLGAATTAGRGIAGQVGADTRALGQGLGATTSGFGQDALSIANQQARAAQQVGAGAQGIGQQAATQGLEQALQAQRGLQQASEFGLQSAQRGMAGLQGTTGAFDPSTVGSFMNPYEQAVIDATMADMQRASDIAGRAEAAQAVGAGAFGGSRQGIVASERGRNLLQQQAQTAAGLRAQGYGASQEAALRAFEDQQRRGQSAAELMGSLGQAGAGTALTAAEAGGRLGIQGVELGTSTQMQAQDLMAQVQQQAAQLGISTNEMAARLGLDVGSLQQQGMLQSAQMGLSAEQQAAANAAQQAGLGLQAAQQAQAAAQASGNLGISGGQLALQGAQLQGSLAGQYSDIGRTGADLGLQASQIGQGIASGIGALGQAQGSLGTQQAALAEAGQTMMGRDIGTLSGLGADARAIEQQRLDAQRQTQMQDVYEPYQRLGFYSDILRGAPTSSNTLTAATAPQASLGSQLVGGATTAVGLGTAANRAGYI